MNYPLTFWKEPTLPIIPKDEFFKKLPEILKEMIPVSAPMASMLSFNDVGLDANRTRCTMVGWYSNGPYIILKLIIDPADTPRHTGSESALFRFTHDNGKVTQYYIGNVLQIGANEGIKVFQVDDTELSKAQRNALLGFLIGRSSNKQRPTRATSRVSTRIVMALAAVLGVGTVAAPIAIISDGTQTCERLANGEPIQNGNYLLGGPRLPKVATVDQVLLECGRRIGHQIPPAKAQDSLAATVAAGGAKDVIPTGVLVDYLEKISPGGDGSPGNKGNQPITLTPEQN